MTVEYVSIESDYSLLHVSGVYGLRVKGQKRIRYVGQAKDLYARFADHRRECLKEAYSHLPVYKWMRKYGPLNIEMVLLEEVPVDTIDSREIYWIEYLGTLVPNGMNCTTGGLGFRGHVNHWNTGRTTPEETRRKISESLTGRRTGPRHGKLDMSKAKAIREASKEGATSLELSSVFNVSRATINRVVAGKIWKETHDSNSSQ